MNPCDEGYRGGHDREAHDVAEGVDTASPLTSRDATDQHVVNGNLTEDHEHKGHGDGERSPARKARHRREEYRLERDYEREYRPDGIAIHEISNDELTKGREGKHNKGVPSHEGCRHRHLGKALVKNLGQREGCALEDEPSECCGEEDNTEHTAEQAPVHRYRTCRHFDPDTVINLGACTSARVQERAVGHPRCN